MVERNLAKVEVASSSLVSRSKTKILSRLLGRIFVLFLSSRSIGGRRYRIIVYLQLNISIIISAKEVFRLGIIGWLVIGALAGWIASKITGNDKEMGAVKNIVVGIIGGIIGGFAMNLIGGYGITGFNVWSLFIATLGAVILLLAINLVKKKKTM